MSGSYVLSGMSTNFFECAICLEEYTNPKTLPCGHTFCGSPKRCMKGLENDEGILCALCKTQNKVKEAGLKTSIIIQDCVEQSRRQHTPGASSSRSVIQESSDIRTDNEAPSTSNATQSSSKIVKPPDWSRLKIVCRDADLRGRFYTVSCAGQYIFASTEDAGSWAIRKYMWKYTRKYMEKEAGIELFDMAKNDLDCILLYVTATQRENGSILLYAAIRSSTGSNGIFHIDPDTLKTRRKVPLPSALEGKKRRQRNISAWEDYLAVGDEETLAILRNGQIVCMLDIQSRTPYRLSLTPAYVVFNTTDKKSSVYRWRSHDGTVLDEPVCMHVFVKCWGTAVFGDTLLTFDMASKRLVRINVSTGERVHMTGDDGEVVSLVLYPARLGGWQYEIIQWEWSGSRDCHLLAAHD